MTMRDSLHYSNSAKPLWSASWLNKMSSGVSSSACWTKRLCTPAGNGTPLQKRLSTEVSRWCGVVMQGGELRVLLTRFRAVVLWQVCGGSHRTTGIAHRQAGSQPR